MSLWPSGGTQPFVATLNDPQGAIVANAAIVPAGATSSPVYGGVSVYNDGPATTDVVIDMNGYFAAPTDVSDNTAIGAGTLASNTTGYYNTASGYGALNANTTGYSNTASGTYALQNNTTGDDTTASGTYALEFNTTGSDNTASGFGALASNRTGSNNTATGYQALYNNAIGDFNLASGNSALGSNTTGGNNTASGILALQGNTTGSYNTASGFNALGNNTTGSSNIALGYVAGLNISTGDFNIDIGNQGLSTDGATLGSAVIRIGEMGTQTSTYIAGISGATASGGVEVFVNANGQLGTMNSSRRFKEQIHRHGRRQQQAVSTASGELLLQTGVRRRRPPAAIWSHRRRGSQSLSRNGGLYGNDGRILSVRYQLLAPMLLNEVQKLAEQNRSLEDRLAAVEALLAAAPAPAP